MVSVNDLTELEKKVIASIQRDIPITKHPYREIAAEMGITEEQYIHCLCGLNAKGIIRRFGATLKHQKSGFAANAMVAWKVEGPDYDAVGEKMASFPEVSHCYQRKIKKEWPYNVYTMIHAETKEACYAIAAQISQQTRVKEYILLFSHKELKKTSMVYFP